VKNMRVGTIFFPNVKDLRMSVSCGLFWQILTSAHLPVELSHVTMLPCDLSVQERPNTGRALSRLYEILRPYLLL
jgi:hypothetical protein